MESAWARVFLRVKTQDSFRNININIHVHTWKIMYIFMYIFVYICIQGNIGLKAVA